MSIQISLLKLFMLSHQSELEVNQISDSDKYIRRSATRQYLEELILQRGAWLVSTVLLAGSAIPISIKMIANLMDSVFTSSSRMDALKNLTAIVLLPTFGVFSAMLGFVSPSHLGHHFIATFFLPAGFFYRIAIKTTIDKRSISDEVGPKLTPNADIAYVNLLTHQTEIKLSKNRSYPTVKGINDIIIDSADIPFASTFSEKKASRHRIVFNASAEFYQLKYSDISYQNQILYCNTRLFNYPGITKLPDFRDFNDLVNAGIAEVYDLSKRMNWSNAEVEQYLHLYGYCFGGGIALQVAGYFKEKHHINLFTFIDRSYDNVQDTAASLLNRHTGLPLWYANILSKTLLYAGGNLNTDSIAVIKKLDPHSIQYINMGYLTEPDVPNTFLKKVKNYFGIGKQATADVIIHDKNSLDYGLKKEKIACGVKTSDIFTELKNTNEHYVYTHDTQAKGHFSKIDQLYIDKYSTEENALEYYARLLDEHDITLKNRP